MVVPTLLSWTESVFVTDLKGELYELTAGWRQEHAHNKVLRFEPAASSGSCCFNPMGIDNIVATKFSPVGEQIVLGPHRSSSRADPF